MPQPTSLPDREMPSAPLPEVLGSERLVVMDFEPSHFDQIRVQKAQAQELGYLPPEWREAVKHFPCFTGFVDSVPIACAGIIPMPLSHGAVWAILAEEAADHMLPLTRAGFRILAAYPYRRIATEVRVGFEAGCRWLQILGFECEGIMKAYAADGSDCYLYARCR